MRRLVSFWSRASLTASTPPSLPTAPQVCVSHRCKKTFFYVFYSGHVFYVFFTFFIFPTFFYFLKRSLKIPPEITFETTETNWVCMIVFLCAHVRISISTYILTRIVIYLPYRLKSSDATRRCAFVYVGKLVDWKISTFFIQRLQTFFLLFLSRFVRFLTFFLYFFSGTFFFTYMVSAASVAVA